LKEESDDIFSQHGSLKEESEVQESEGIEIDNGLGEEESTNTLTTNVWKKYFGIKDQPDDQEDTFCEDELSSWFDQDLPVINTL
jgi:hypothetical protein